MQNSKEQPKYSRDDYIRAMQITMQKYGREQLAFALKNLFLSNNADGFTRDGNSRQTLAQDIHKTKKEILNIICNQQEEDFNLSENEFIRSMQFTMQKYGTKQLAYALENLFLSNNADGFTRACNSRHIIAQNIDKAKKEIATTICNEFAKKLPLKELLPQGAVASIQERVKNMKKTSVLAKLSGCDDFDYSYTQSKSIGNMQLASNKGPSKDNQEDAGLIIQHPNFPKFKMLVVADGVGGIEKGELASNYLIETIQKWFETLPEEYYNSSTNASLEDSLQNIICSISENINTKYENAGTTFLSAIVRDNDVKIANIGNSLAFGYKNGHLTQLGEDDSYTTMLYNINDLPDGLKDDLEENDIRDLRFHVDSNYIMTAVGAGISNPELHFFSAPKDQTIILCTDGVSDCLSLKDFQDIIYSVKTNKETLAEAIVNRATDGSKSLRPEYLDKYPDIFYSDITRGSDNGTLAALIPENSEPEDDER